MVTLGLEWGLDGPKYFAYSREDLMIVKIPATPPPRLRGDLVGDSKDIYLFGLREFGVWVNVVDKVVMAVNNLAEVIMGYLGGGRFGLSVAEVFGVVRRVGVFLIVGYLL